MIKRILLFSLTFFLSQTLSYAQIHINEYSASNLNRFLDSFNKTEDWIELYNSSDMAVDISGWHLSDKETNPTKWEIPDSTIIPAKGHLVFWCSGRDQFVNGEYHTSFKLTQTKDNEFVSLADANGNVIEVFPLQLTLVEHSRCRAMDGSADWVVCTEPTPQASNNDSTTQYLGYTQTPTMDLNAGFYNGEQTITITNNEPNSVLRYTLDGTNPTATSPEYIAPLMVSETQVIKAQAFSNDPAILSGKMDFNTYFIDEPDYTLPVFSIGANDVIDLANGQGELIPIGSLEYFNKDDQREAVGFGEMNRHGQDSWVLDHRSLDWITRDEMGYEKAINAKIFADKERDEFQRFMFRNSGDDNYPAIDDFEHQGSTHIRDEYVQQLAYEGGLKLDHRTVERVIVFLNGRYWGVYGMREKIVDHDYTSEYYDQGKYDLQFLSTWGDTELRYGGQKALSDWRSIRDFILENDMSLPENYQIADDSINLLSMIDYMIVNLNVVASDWMNYNTGWWRGLNPDGDHKKWGYLLWDLDATFDYYINYSGVPNTNPDADPCDIEEISDYMDEFFPPENDGNTAIEDCPSIVSGDCPYPADDPYLPSVFSFAPECCNNWGGFCNNIYNWISENGEPNAEPTIQGNVGKHEKIFLKLIEENETFRQLYYSRYADLMNTVYSCDNMIETLDRMIAVIEPEMPGQIERWGGSMQEWQDNVQDLKDFILERCTLLDDGMLECYEELSGPYTLTLMAEPLGVGEIDLNTLDIEEFPWNGDYFGGMENLIKARVFNDFEDDYVFSHWESSAGNIIFPDEFTRKATITLTQSDTLTAIFALNTSTNDQLDAQFEFNVFPNPVKDVVHLEYNLEQSADVQISLYSVLGQQVANFPLASGRQNAGDYRHQLQLDPQEVTEGLYFLRVQIDQQERSFKINVMR